MKLPLRILLFTDGLFLLAASMLGPIYAIFVEKIGGDILVAGASFAIFSLILGIVILIMGKIEDKVLKETELWVSIGYFIIALGFFSYLFVKSPWHLFIAQAILGLGEAIESPAYSAVYSKHLDHKKRAFQWGSWDAMRNFAAAGGALVGALIAFNFNFQALFVIMGSLSLVAGLVIFFQPRRVL